ncbi:hypothetical protein IPG36_02430 [bacterium]|nr:MAG: hypothetical protein IPG36_02430 [bacterium]
MALEAPVSLILAETTSCSNRAATVIRLSSQKHFPSLLKIELRDQEFGSYPNWGRSVRIRQRAAKRPHLKIRAMWLRPG